MESKNRLLIAVTLSLLVMVVFQKFYIAPQAKHTRQQQQAPSSQKLGSQQTSASPPSQETALYMPPGDEKFTTLENEVFIIQISNEGARIKQIWLKKFKDTKTDEPLALLDTEITYQTFSGPLLIEDLFLESNAPKMWNFTFQNGNSVIYSYTSPSGAVISKEIFLHNSNYSIGLRLKLHNSSTTALPVKYKVTGGSSLLAKNAIDDRFTGADVKIDQDIKRIPIRHKSLKQGGKIYYDSPSWVSTRSRYFTIALEPKQKEETYFIEKEGAKGIKSGIIIGPLTIKPFTTVYKEYLIYAGPNDIAEIKAVSATLDELISYGFFGGISTLLLRILNAYHKIFNNYGISIIMLVITINLVLFPLTRKSMTSIKAMQELQPETERLKKEIKNNPQKLNKEIMALYKKHKVNPLSGCLPMLFQMPIFIALYQALTRAVWLKGANFLWIKDLSEPDAAFKLPITVPFLGEYINILPLLMMIAMFLQQKITQPKAGQSEQQKMMAVMMPLLFGFIFYNMPSGLVLYWLTSTTVMLVLQEFVLKMRHTKPAPA